MGEELASYFQELGLRGVLIQMAEHDQIIESRCEMPSCYCPKGRRYFDPRTPRLSDWAPNPDHYPILKSVGGHLRPENVRLAHVLCNLRNHGWRMRIKALLARGKSLQEIAEELNRKDIPVPHGRNRWTAITVRKAYVS
jgi:hypothetical protein